ncbi:MAG TPA: hypothetical protein VMU20_19165 [Candidatus Dormibacteraeota bacterium]|jgi:hypothetical protein|nr:hypothetical protein [Candidatus Dormibacteraeota bacterium]
MDVRVPRTLRGAAGVWVLGRRVCKLGRCVVIAALFTAAFLAVTITATLVGESGSSTRITLTMPCSSVDAASVGHSGYGLDEVISAGCSVTRPR